MTPARYVIKQFGGVRAAAKAIGVSPSTVSTWNKRKTPKDYRGLNGRIPAKNWDAILRAAKRRKKRITYKNLLG